MFCIHHRKIELHIKFILGLEISGNDSTVPSQLTYLKSNHQDYEAKLQIAQLFYNTVILIGVLYYFLS